MTSERAPDRLRGFVDLLIQSLEDGAGGASIARRAFLSRFHFDRLVAAALGESPGGFRRRLLLERAAYTLASGPMPVTDVALDAGYSSLEAFERAFRRGFGTTPSAFRRRPAPFRLPSPNGVHFHPPHGLLVPGPTRRTPMDPIDRMLEHDLWLSRRLLDRAAGLSEEELDRDVRGGREPRPYESSQPTVRGMLDRLVVTREIWTAAVAGRAGPDAERDTSVAGLRSRLDAACAEFSALVRGIRDRQEWDTAFVDALCDPPESFTYGGVVAHVLTFQACRRTELIDALAGLGIRDVGYGDPLDWERAALEGRA